MAAIANVVLTDSAAVDHTFAPLSTEAGVLDIWMDRASGIRIGMPQLSLGIRQPNKSARTAKVTLKLSLPTMEVTSPSTETGIQPAPTIAYTLLGTAEFVLHERSTLLERQNLLAMLRDAIDEAIVTAAVSTYDIPY